jgi:hypothetical protein
VSGRCRLSRIIAQLGFLEGESFDRSSLLFDERRTTRARATLLAQFRSGVIVTEELPDGYAFRLPSDCRWVAIIAEMIMTNQNYLAITTVVQELLSLGKSRLAAMRISSRGRSPRTIGQ